VCKNFLFFKNIHIQLFFFFFKYRITEILEERGWSRTKDNSVTNFTIKWCLAHQVNWNQFQEGKQLINNIPGQLAFSDKINLWFTIRDYLRNKRTLDGNHIQTFLPMTFVLDDENGIADFLRSYKSNYFFLKTIEKRKQEQMEYTFVD